MEIFWGANRRYKEGFWVSGYIVFLQHESRRDMFHLRSFSKLYNYEMCSLNMLEWKWKLLSHEQTLCDPVDYTTHGILQARILEWVNFPFSRGSFQPRDWTQVFRIAGRFFTSLATGEVHMLDFSPKFCIYTHLHVCVCVRLWVC